MSRPHLLQRLCSARKKRLALIVAPAGTGKTQLLAEACQQLRRSDTSCAWLTIDATDADPLQFIRHLTFALQLALPAVGQETLLLLQSDKPPLESALSCLINDLAAHQGHVAIFLDDFHEADNQDVSKLTSYFLRYLPPKVHLLIAGRRNFLPSLSWARARHWTLCFGWADLFFSSSETRAYLLEIRGLKLSKSETDRLADETQGWIGALQLASRQPSAYRIDPCSLASNCAEFASPLLDDLLDQLAPPLQSFLLETSPLENLCPSICNAIRQRDDSQTLLDELQQTYALIHHQGERLHYPKLLRDFLRRRLRSNSPDLFATLHRRAGDWLAEQKEYGCALQHCLKASATEAITQLLVKHGKSLLLDANNYPLLQTSLDHLSDHLSRPLPELETLRAWCALLSGQPLVASRALCRAREKRQFTGMENTSPERLEWQLLQVLLGISRYAWPTTEDFPIGLEKFFDQSHPLLQTSAYLAYAHTQRYRDELFLAQNAYRDTAELAKAHQSPIHALLAQQGQVSIDLLQARPDRALLRLEAWLVNPAPQLGLLKTLHAQALMDRGLSHEATVQLEAALHLLTKTNLPGHLGWAFVLMAELHAENGAEDAAHTCLAQARTLALPHSISRVLFRADLCEAMLCLSKDLPQEGNALLEHASGILRESKQSSGENFEAWQIKRCLFLVFTHQYEEARDLALQGETAARSAGRYRHCIDFLLLRAAALTNLFGHQPASRDCIEQARQLAKPGGIIRPFQSLAAIVEIPQINGENERQLPENSLRLPDHLNQREEQILRLLEQGLRNSEIAARLFLSNETIKWYLKRLYGDFAVGNRIQLIALVKKLGLLGDDAH